MSVPATDIDGGELKRLPTRPRRPGALLVAVAGLGVVAAWGCATYRIEYHRRPAFYRQAAMGKLPDRVTLEDGTVIVFEEDGVGAGGRGRARKPFQIRLVRDDGSIVLRCRMPEDVLVNTITCLHNEEYKLLWEQMLSERTKAAYEERLEGVEEFSAFFARNRRDLLAALTRMRLGIPRQEVIIENLGGRVIRYRFRPHIATQFKFKRLEMISEGPGLKLLMIR